MLFSSVPFLYYFLPAVVVIYFAAPRKRRNAVIAAASMAFYAWGEQLLVLLFALSVLLGWLAGILIENAEKQTAKKAILTASVLTDSALLGYFKYADFFISSFNGVFGASVPLLNIALPIGISFYTFQLISYTADVYRSDVRAQRNIIDFAAYISFFPQLIAGPIVRYADVAKQLKGRSCSVDKAASGIRRFLTGLGKKVLIANILGETVDAFQTTTDPSVLFFWLYAAAYMLQVYFDFSGYSDMAIGLGRIFGFELTENFNYPYISASITEFWRRWHITLGSWFRDYVYIPLGGNRRGLGRQLINILVVWMLTGLWHGAAWSFVLWGLYFAVLLIIEKAGLKKLLDRHPVFGHIYTLFAVMLGFLLFNASDPAQAIRDISGMFAFGRLPLISTEAMYHLRSCGVVLIIGVIGATPLPKRIIERISENGNIAKALEFAEPVFLASVLLISTAYLVDGSFNPFLYFRF